MTGQPYDGRDRRAPEWESGLSPDEFEDALVRLVVENVAKNFQSVAIPKEYTQDQAREYHSRWLETFSFFAWRFPSWLLEVASRCPYQDVRRDIISDCVDEEVGDPDAGGRCHIDVLYEEAEACGLPREEMAAAQPTALITTCMLAFDDLSRTLPWEAAYCAISALEIINSKPAVELRSEMMTDAQRAAWEEATSSSLPERLGIPSENLLFNALHAYKDQFHGGGELELLRRYATDSRIQHEMLWAAKTSIEVMGLYINECVRLSRAAVEG